MISVFFPVVDVYRSMNYDRGYNTPCEPSLTTRITKSLLVLHLSKLSKQTSILINHNSSHFSQYLSPAHEDICFGCSAVSSMKRGCRLNDIGDAKGRALPHFYPTVTWIMIATKTTLIDSVPQNLIDTVAPKYDHTMPAAPDFFTTVKTSAY